MPTSALFAPVFAMAALTFVVWVRMYSERIGQMKRLRIHPQSVANSAAMSAAVPDTRAVDNFRNLFEVPVLFYAAVFVAHALGQAGTTTVALAWAYVALRVVHSAIACSYNKVMHRFWAYVASCSVLWALWFAIGIGAYA